MFSIRCEQFMLQKEASPPTGPDGKPVSIIKVMNFTPLPLQAADGSPMLIQMGTCMVEVVLDARERRQLIAMLEADELERATAGEPRPEGVAVGRCGRVARHESHTWRPDPNAPSHPDHELWCDGLVWVEGDALPEITS